MNITQHVFIIVASCVVLGVGASWLVDAAARIAKWFGISQLVIGLTIVAFGSSAPEFAVSVTAALKGDHNISVGNIVGSNIFNIGFILGACAMVTAIKTSATLVWRDGLLLLAVTVGLLVMLGDHELSRFEGCGLFVVLIGYLVYLFWKREPVVADDEPSGRSATWLDGPMLLLGLVLICGGGYFLVESAKVLAGAFGMSQWVIAMTIVAMGTSVPELVISLVAIIKKHHGISAGNLIGSNLFNTMGVLGVAGALRPLTVDPSSLQSIVLLIVLTVIVLVFMRSGWRISRWQGVALILISLVIWGYEIYRQSPQTAPGP